MAASDATEAKPAFVTHHSVEVSCIGECGRKRMVLCYDALGERPEAIKWTCGQCDELRMRLCSVCQRPCNHRYATTRDGMVLPHTRCSICRGCIHAPPVRSWHGCAPLPGESYDALCVSLNADTRELQVEPPKAGLREGRWCVVGEYHFGCARCVKCDKPVMSPVARGAPVDSSTWCVVERPSRADPMNGSSLLAFVHVPTCPRV